MAKQLFGTDGIRGVPGEARSDDATLDRVGHGARRIHLGSACAFGRVATAS